MPPVGPGVARPPSAFVTLWALDNASSDNVISARVSVFLHCPVILEITIIAYFVLRKKTQLAAVIFSTAQCVVMEVADVNR